MRQNKNSILTSLVPPEMGAPSHWEHYGNDYVARTDYANDGTVEAIHTPQQVLPRIHETLHALHSNPTLINDYYIKHGIMTQVWQIVEDCRIHLNHWHWNNDGSTPKEIYNAITTELWDELRTTKQAEKELAENDIPDIGYRAFASRLRALCVAKGMYHGESTIIHEFPGRDRRLAKELHGMIIYDRITEAAKLLQDAFFSDPEMDISSDYEEKEFAGKWDKEEGEYTKQWAQQKTVHGKTAYGESDPPVMDIIELPHTKAIKDESVGTRIAKSGLRLYRRALRKPILPERLFVRTARKYPGGTILVDASGSMGEWSNIVKWCEESPHATLAYYAGNDSESFPSGQLFIYARDGFRSEHVIGPNDRGNSIDGLAMDWLLSQRAPRIFITDRGFCGSPDSIAQIVRLERLEKLGEIEVRNYKVKSDDKDED